VSLLVNPFRKRKVVHTKMNRGLKDFLADQLADDGTPSRCCLHPSGSSACVISSVSRVKSAGLGPDTTHHAHGEVNRSGQGSVTGHRWSKEVTTTMILLRRLAQRS
jgi:hypothetical protein